MTKSLSLMLIFSLAVLLSCNKQYQPPTIVISKWREVKLRLYEINNGATIYDTTYYKPFTGLDYIQFNSDGTCYIGQDYNYFPSLAVYPKKPQPITPSLREMDWINIGEAYVVTPLPIKGPQPPGIPPSSDTAFFSPSDTMRFQTVGPFAPPVIRVVSEGYYVRY